MCALLAVVAKLVSACAVHRTNAARPQLGADERRDRESTGGCFGALQRQSAFLLRVSSRMDSYRMQPSLQLLAWVDGLGRYRHTGDWA
mmetsp:Transcript_50392/g.107896  ORF Transcript_50392/g.107896 Transcript_50392/m.107896 type:complete len:88 (-) Transcript_50392:409-672(-)